MDLHEMAPGVPTGPGEGMRSAGAFPGMIIQTEDNDYRGMKHEPPGRGPPFMGPSLTGGSGQCVRRGSRQTIKFSSERNWALFRAIKCKKRETSTFFRDAAWASDCGAASEWSSHQGSRSRESKRIH